MNKAQKYLIDNNLADIVLNEKEFPENTPDNAKKWIYLSDVLTQYSEQQVSKLPIHSVSKCSQEWKADTFDNMGFCLTEFCENCDETRDTGC